MGKVGTIRNVSGCLSGKSVSIYNEGGEYFIQSDGWSKSEVINLSEDLVSVNFERHKKASKMGIATRTLAGGLAGSAYGKGKTGLTGALYFLGHSIGSHTESTFIALTFDNGESLHGEADSRTASLIASIPTNEKSVVATQRIEAENAKKKRFLKDAPRTYFEVKESIDQIESKMQVLEDQKDNAATFEEREKALSDYSLLENQRQEKKELLSDLELELKARKAGFGSYDDMYEKQIEVSQRGYELQRLIAVPKIKILLYLISVYMFFSFIADEDNFTKLHPIGFIYFTYYTPVFLFWVFLRPSRKKHLKKIHEEYDKIDHDKISVEPEKQTA